MINSVKAMALPVMMAAVRATNEVGKSDSKEESGGFGAKEIAFVAGGAICLGCSIVIAVVSLKNKFSNTRAPQNQEPVVPMNNITITNTVVNETPEVVNHAPDNVEARQIDANEETQKAYDEDPYVLPGTPVPTTSPPDAHKPVVPTLKLYENTPKPRQVDPGPSADNTPRQHDILKDKSRDRAETFARKGESNDNNTTKD